MEKKDENDLLNKSDDQFREWIKKKLEEWGKNFLNKHKS